MAKTKAAGGTKLGRDSRPKFLGVKLFDGEKVATGMIIVRQHGTKIHAGKNVKTGKDYTLYAACAGAVKFRSSRRKAFNGTQKTVKVVDVLEAAAKPEAKKTASKKK